MKTYSVAQALSLDKLMALVNDAINEGYKPQGGISVMHINHNLPPQIPDGKEEVEVRPTILYTQAIYKE